VADKRCENGHFIDESWDLCPYCPAENAESDIPVVRPTRFGAQDGQQASKRRDRRAGRRHVASAGDSFSYRSEQPHSFRNNGSKEARVLWINTPPTF